MVSTTRSGGPGFSENVGRSTLPPPPDLVRTVRSGATLEVRAEPVDRMAWMTWLSGLVVAAGVTCAILGDIPLSLPMPTHAIGWVTPTCGLTRGTVAILRGHFGLAFDYNPVSFAVLPIVTAGIVRSVLGLVRKRWVNITVRPDRRLTLAVVGALVALGIYQQSNAMFIMHSHRL